MYLLEAAVTSIITTAAFSAIGAAASGGDFWMNFSKSFVANITTNFALSVATGGLGAGFEAIGMSAKLAGTFSGIFVFGGYGYGTGGLQGALTGAFVGGLAGAVSPQISAGVRESLPNAAVWLQRTVTTAINSLFGSVLPASTDLPSRSNGTNPPPQQSLPTMGTP